MSKKPQRGIRLSIRTKLVLVSTTLLIIPWVGTRYIQEMEDYLRQQQEEALLTRTQTVASVLQARPELFKLQTAAPLPTRGVQHLYVRPLNSNVQLDGYLDEWRQYQDRTLHFDQSHAVIGSESSALSFDVQTGSYQKYLYIALKVKDKKILYHLPSNASREDCDHIVLSLENPEGEQLKYVISSIAPGWVNAYRIREHTSADEDEPIRYDNEIRIKGGWQETAHGYTVEFRIPIELVGARISLAVADVNDPRKRTIDTLITTTGINDPNALSTIVFPSPDVDVLLQRLQRPLTRTWVIDRHNRVIAQTGSIINTESDNTSTEPDTAEKNKPSFISRMLSLVYSAILKQPSNEFHDDLLNVSRLDSEEFKQALLGQPSTHWRQTNDKNVNILTAAHPVFAQGEVIGAIAIEQTSNSILLLQNRAFEILFNISALAFLLASIVLLAFATRLSQRVRRLRDDAEHAITRDGKVVGSLRPTHATDEIGDLSRSVADMLSRLTQYNRYLETMASKLSHELRTPITVVRSSLDNLENSELSQPVKTYIDRAREGIDRLSNILTRMSEATRLEQTLQGEQPVIFELNRVIEGCVAGYRLAHPLIHIDINIDADANTSGWKIHGVPDLLAQMLDKLVSNAIDFHTPGSPIVITMRPQQTTLQLQISNTGRLLPDAMRANLFDSMVSVREQRSEQPHLGLGLYIVRLIVEFHQGQVHADNLPDGSGVVFEVNLPLHLES